VTGDPLPSWLPILGAGISALYAAATEHKWTLVDMAADWAVVYPPLP